MKRHVLLLTTLALLAGCASAPPTRYYTLDMTASGRAEPVVNLTVDRIRPTEALARKQILVKKSPTEIEYYAVDEWAAGLDELVAEKLAAEFGPKEEGRKTIAVSGTILAFEQLDRPDGVEVRVKLDLALREENDGQYADPLLEKTYETGQPAAGPNAVAVVTALSKCLEEIAVQLAADAGAL